MAAHAAAPNGPPFWKYNIIDMARYLEIEAGVAVAQPVEGDGRIISGTLRAGRYVTMRHVGHPTTLMAATAALLDWAAQRELTGDVAPSSDGERWGARVEFYLSAPDVEPDMTKWVTDLVFRLAS